MVIIVTGMQAAYPITVFCLYPYPWLVMTFFPLPRNTKREDTFACVIKQHYLLFLKVIGFTFDSVLVKRKMRPWYAADFSLRRCCGLKLKKLGSVTLTFSRFYFGANVSQVYVRCSSVDNRSSVYARLFGRFFVVKRNLQIIKSFVRKLPTKNQKGC